MPSHQTHKAGDQACQPKRCGEPANHALPKNPDPARRPIGPQLARVLTGNWQEPIARRSATGTKDDLMGCEISPETPTRVASFPRRPMA